MKSSVAAGVVSGEVRDRLAKLLFGPDGGANASPAMKRLLDSWSELGYPSEGKVNGAQRNRYLERPDDRMTDIV